MKRIVVCLLCGSHSYYHCCCLRFFLLVYVSIKCVCMCIYFNWNRLGVFLSQAWVIRLETHWNHSETQTHQWRLSLLVWQSCESHAIVLGSRQLSFISLILILIFGFMLSGTFLRLYFGLLLFIHQNKLIEYKKQNQVFDL